jgi:hypothetical protein
MKDLEVHDKVYTGWNTKTGAPVYQSIYSFGHLDSASEFEYLRLFHDQIIMTSADDDDDQPIELSAAHLIFLAETSHPVRADTLQVGDRLVLKKNECDQYVTIRKIESIVREGAYLPLTLDGTIVVNNIAASAYVSIHHNAPSVIGLITPNLSEQSLFHMWMAPYRMVCMGVSAKLCQDDYNQEGIIYWLAFGQGLAEIWEEQCYLVQIVGVALVMFVLGICVGAEMIFGSQLGALGVVLTVGAAMIYHRNSRSSTSVFSATEK